LLAVTSLVLRKPVCGALLRAVYDVDATTCRRYWLPLACMPHLINFCVDCAVNRAHLQLCIA
jgi:hypothetical protein